MLCFITSWLTRLNRNTEFSGRNNRVSNTSSNLSCRKILQADALTNSLNDEFNLSELRRALQETKQEAQPPFRNRASAMHFLIAKLLSIAVMTYSYVYHLRKLRPANLLRTQPINVSMRPQHVRMTRDPTDV